jgi:hypothetical protein
MLPIRDQGPTLIDTGELGNEGFADLRTTGITVVWDDDDDDDEDEDKKTQMILVPSEQSSQRALRVLPAVPAVWTPPRPSAPMTAAPHWVPPPPPPRVSLPTAPEWNPAWDDPPIVAQPPPPEPHATQEVSNAGAFIVRGIAHGAGPHVAVTVATPRTPPAPAKRPRILRRVVLPWPAAVMIAAVAGAVIFEHAQRGDTLSAIGSTVESAQRLVRR